MRGRADEEYMSIVPYDTNIGKRKRKTENETENGTCSNHTKNIFNGKRQKRRKIGSFLDKVSERKNKER